MNNVCIFWSGWGPWEPLAGVWGHTWPRGALPSTMAPSLQQLLASGCISGAWSPWNIYCIEGNCPSLYPSAGIPYSMTGWNNLVLLNQWCWSCTDWQASVLQPGCFVAHIKLIQKRGKVWWWAPSALLKGLPVCVDGGVEKTGWVLSPFCSSIELPLFPSAIQSLPALLLSQDIMLQWLHIWNKWWAAQFPGLVFSYLQDEILRYFTVSSSSLCFMRSFFKNFFKCSFM